MTVINQFDVLNEVVMSLRSADVMSVDERGVVRTTQTGVLNDDDGILIDKSNVKNVVSITVDTVPITGFNVDTETDEECNITLKNSMSGDYIVTYDYGPDKIFSGYPRSDLNINSFPRIAVEYISMGSEPGGFGNVNRNRHDISISIYNFDKSKIRDTIHKIRTWCVNNQNGLSTLKLIKPVLIGPLAPAGEFTKFKDKVMKQNFDFVGLLQYEIYNGV